MKNTTDCIDIAACVTHSAWQHEFGRKKRGPARQTLNHFGGIRRYPLWHQMWIHSQWELQKADVSRSLILPILHRLTPQRVQ